MLTMLAILTNYHSDKKESERFFKNVLFYRYYIFTAERRKNVLGFK